MFFSSYKYLLKPNTMTEFIMISLKQNQTYKKGNEFINFILSFKQTKYQSSSFVIRNLNPTVGINITLKL